MQTINVTIPAGQSLSEPVDCTGHAIAHIGMPMEWSGGAPLTFQLAADGQDFRDVFRSVPDKGTLFEMTVPAVTPGSVVDSPTAGAPYPFVRIRSGTRTVPVKQEADRTFQLMLAPVQTAPPGDGRADGRRH
jgi:hypothetical protein